MLPPELRRKIEDVADQRGCTAEELVERWVERAHTHQQDRADPDPTAHRLLESIREGVFLLGPDDRLEFVNDRPAEVLGEHLNELTGQPLEALFQRDPLGNIDAEAVRTAIGRVRREEVAEDRLELNISAAPGEELTLELRVSLLANDPERVVLVTRDVTERKEIEARLRERETRLRGLANSIPGVVFQFVAHPDGTYGNTFVSQHAETLLGIDPDPDGFFDRCLEGIPESHRQAYLDSIEEAVENRAKWSFETPFEKPSGERIWVRGISTPTERGERVYFDGVILETTERKTYEQQLIEARNEARQASEMKSALLENMSHELRTPLASVIGFADLLAGKGDGTVQEFAEKIREGGQRLLDTLDAVLSLAELEGEGMTIEPAEVDAARVVRRAARTLQAKAQRKGLTIDTVGLEAPVRAVIDPQMLSRVVAHLVSNGIKFTREGSVTISLEATGSHLTVEVRDTGIGIDADTRDRIFDPFFQVSSGLSREYEGAGLGLTITRRLVDLAGGTIEVRDLEDGTSVTVELPRVLPDREDEVSTEGPKESWGFDQLPGARVLLVDDDASIRQLIDELLPEEIDVNEAATPEEAMEEVRSEPFDVILLDINLKAERNGVELLEQIRSEYDSDGPLVVALTAYATSGDGAAFHEAGFDGYVPKPFTRETLRRNLIQVVEDGP